MDDMINRRAAINEIDEWIKAFRENGHKESAADACLIQDGIIQLPTAQPEPAIPISWLKKEIEHLESRENSFAVLDAMQLKTLIKRWRGEQNENT